MRVPASRLAAAVVLGLVLVLHATAHAQDCSVDPDGTIHALRGMSAPGAGGPADPAGAAGAGEQPAPAAAPEPQPGEDDDPPDPVPPPQPREDPPP